jgi:two-component system, NtrC family, sensor kinase
VHQPPGWDIITEAKIESAKSVLGFYSLRLSGWIGEDLLNRKLVQIDEVQQLNDSVAKRLSHRFGTKSFLAIPIPSRQSVFGVVICGQVEQVREWQPEEIEFLKSVVDQLAIAISQAELYAEAKNNADEARTQAERLAAAMKELQQTQTQLIQTEKMSSLGQMVAGIAHEINNPVSFIYGNLNYVEEYTQSLIRLIELYQEEYKAPSEALVVELEEIGLDFLIDDLAKILNSMQVGAERISEIVHSLRNFARLDESDFKAVNIHEGIDSTLVILDSRLKANSKRSQITIIKDYGDLPKVACYAGQLNQVFMNILTNAIDAIDESPKQTPTITIRTRQIGQEIEIAIADNGSGISEVVQSKLFDPFFTTKPVGKGTGLGLSVSYQIVTERHRGQLECRSAAGKGTEFLIRMAIT